MAQFTNPLFSPACGSERTTSSGGEQQSSASGESFCAAYRPSPIPLRSIGDVVNRQGKVQAVKVAPTTKSLHNKMQCVGQKSSSAVGGPVYRSSIFLPSGDIIPATTNLLAESGLQWTAHNPPWHEEHDASASGRDLPCSKYLDETSHPPGTPLSRTPKQRRRSSSQTMRDRFQKTFSRSFGRSGRPRGRASSSTRLGDDSIDHVRVSCFRRSDGSISSCASSNPLLPVSRKLKEGVHRISSLGAHDMSQWSGRATQQDVASTPPLHRSPAKSTVSSLPSCSTADMQHSSAGGVGTHSADGLDSAARSTVQAASRMFSFITPRKRRGGQPEPSPQSVKAADSYLGKLSPAGTTLPDSTSPPRIGTQCNVKDSPAASGVEQSLNLQSRVASTSQGCSPGQLSPCDSLLTPHGDEEDTVTPTQMLRDAYGSEMGYSAKLIAGAQASEIGNPTQMLFDTYGSDMSLVRVDRLRAMRVGLRDGGAAGMRPRALHRAALRRAAGDSCSIRLPHDSGQLDDSGDTQGSPAQSAGLQRRQGSVRPPTSASVPLKKRTLRERQQRRRLEWTQAHASGMWHGRTLADLNQLRKEWQDLNTSIGASRSRTVSPARIRLPKGVSGTSQSMRLSASRARRRMQHAEPSSELAQLNAGTSNSGSPTSRHRKGLGAHCNGRHAAKNEEVSSPRSVTAAARTTRRQRSATAHTFVSAKTRPFIGQASSGNDSTRPRVASSPTPRRARSVRTVDAFDADRCKGEQSKHMPRKQGSTQHVPPSVHTMDAQSEDVRYANTATKRVGRDPRPKSRICKSPDSRGASQFPDKGLGKACSEDKVQASYHTQSVVSGTPRSVRAAREPKWLVDQKKSARERKLAASSPPAAAKSRVALRDGYNSAGALVRSTRVDSIAGVVRGKKDLPKRALSRGDKRGVWR